MQRRKRIVQIVSDLAAITPDLSVLDIARLEGHYAPAQQKAPWPEPIR